MKKIPVLTIAILMISLSLPAFAWEKRGHAEIALTAAYLLGDTAATSFLKKHSFDLQYYANVPDMVWKGPETYDIESTEHYMDLEHYVKEKDKDENKEKFWLENRTEFTTAHPSLSDKSGRAWWRVVELDQKLKEVTAKLNESLDKKEHQKQQAQWLLIAGVMSHYVADMSQPLHASENYDGQLSGQKGIHSFFEGLMVDELYPEIFPTVLKMAQSKWPQFQKANKDKSAFTLTMELTMRANKQMDQLLKIDKKVGRDDIKKAKLAYKKMITDQFVEGSLALALIWQKHLGWKYQGDRFYEFISTPPYVKPNK